MTIESGTKAQPDTGKLDLEIVSKADTKVALDTEDAPFLQEAAPPAVAPSPALSLEPQEDNADQLAARKKKKKLIIIAAATTLLLAAFALWWFVLRKPPLPPPVIEPEVIVVPDAENAATPKEYYINFEPFWVELPASSAASSASIAATGQDGGNVVFLVCKFSAVTLSENLALEAQNKMILLRDAVYYYIKNKAYQFLIDPANGETIKADLNSILSGYLAGGKIDGMLFESYLGR